METRGASQNGILGLQQAQQLWQTRSSFCSRSREEAQMMLAF